VEDTGFIFFVEEDKIFSSGIILFKIIPSEKRIFHL